MSSESPRASTTRPLRAAKTLSAARGVPQRRRWCSEPLEREPAVHNLHRKELAVREGGAERVQVHASRLRWHAKLHADLHRLAAALEGAEEGDRVELERVPARPDRRFLRTAERTRSHVTACAGAPPAGSACTHTVAPNCPREPCWSQPKPTSTKKTCLNDVSVESVAFRFALRHSSDLRRSRTCDAWRKGSAAGASGGVVVVLRTRTDRRRWRWLPGLDDREARSREAAAPRRDARRGDAPRSSPTARTRSPWSAFFSRLQQKLPAVPCVCRRAAGSCGAAAAARRRARRRRCCGSRGETGRQIRAGRTTDRRHGLDGLPRATPRERARVDGLTQGVPLQQLFDTPGAARARSPQLKKQRRESGGAMSSSRAGRRRAEQARRPARVACCWVPLRAGPRASAARLRLRTL